MAVDLRFIERFDTVLKMTKKRGAAISIDRDVCLTELSVKRGLTVIAFFYFDYSQCYTQEDLVHMALETWVKIVEGKLIALDRYENKERKHRRFEHGQQLIQDCHCFWCVLTPI